MAACHPAFAAALCPAPAEAAWADIVPALDVLDGALRRSGWLVGDAFSIADLNVAAALLRGLSNSMAAIRRGSPSSAKT